MRNVKGEMIDWCMLFVFHSFPGPVIIESRGLEYSLQQRLLTLEQGLPMSIKPTHTCFGTRETMYTLHGKAPIDQPRAPVLAATISSKSTLAESWHRSGYPSSTQESTLDRTGEKLSMLPDSQQPYVPEWALGILKMALLHIWATSYI